MIQEIYAIDTHTHLNHGSIYDSAADSLIYNASLDYLTAMNRTARIETMFCSTFASVIEPQVIEEENQYLADLVQQVPYLYQWVVIDPRIENTFRQADRMLCSKCVGIKLHPSYHGYSLTEYGDKLFAYASERQAIVQIHPETDADYILPFADKYEKVTFIMAHMGSHREDSYANAITKSKHGNVYVDTSGIASSRNKVVEYMVEQAGSEHILFGTDTYAAGFQRGRIEYALISDEDKENILRRNALRVFAKILNPAICS